MYRKSIREFLQGKFPPRQPPSGARAASARRGSLETGGRDWPSRFPDILEEFGGGGGTFAHQAVVTEELAQAGVQLRMRRSEHLFLALPLLNYGTDVQKKKWLPAMAQGELVGALTATTEPSAGSDLQCH